MQLSEQAGSLTVRDGFEGYPLLIETTCTEFSPSHSYRGIRIKRTHAPPSAAQSAPETQR
jgi:hypothetical protein